jgi:hypothetical protein
MSKIFKSLDLYRLTIEGLVIVVSILLAFAIDAWWDKRREMSDAEDQVARVVAELHANIAILQAQNAALEHATEGAREFLSIMGPDAGPVSVQTVGEMMYRIYGVPTLSLSSSATRNLLSSGQLTAGRWIDIRLALTELLSRMQLAEDASQELRQMRPEMLEHMRPYVSGLDVVKMNPTMERYPTSRFQSDAGSLLSDMSFESLIAYYAIRMEINRDYVTSLLKEHGAVIETIEGER